MAAACVGTISASAQTTGTCEPPIGQAVIDVNNVRASIYNTGGLFWRGGTNMYNVPKGGANNAIFASGIWFAGMRDDNLRVSGSRYGPWEFWAGPLGDKGEPPANCEPFDRVWKVSRKDVAAYEFDGTTTPDLRDWPTGLGAPTMGADGEPVDLMDQKLMSRIDRKINLEAGERPLITGDQMLWWINNDRGNVHQSFDTPPIGLEIHGSAFAWDRPETLGNATFYRYRVFYRGKVPLTDTYMSIFSDPDLGSASDDYVGSDPGLDLGYVYNADPDDDGAYGSDVPSTGFTLLQGPLVRNNGMDDDDDGVVDEPGERLGMTSFMFFVGGGGDTQGDPNLPEEAYNFMRGRWGTGEFLTEGGSGLRATERVVKYAFPAQPGAYWSELNTDGAGGINTPSDRRLVVSTGPYRMEPDDEQEIMFAIVTGFGGDNLRSVDRMKDDARVVKAFRELDFRLPRPPDAPQVTASTLDGTIILEWDNLPNGNNFLDQYREQNLITGPPEPEYVLEGYNVYKYDSPSDREGELIAVYDVMNGVTRVVEPGDSTLVVTARGTDSGLRHHHTISGLTNYKDYYFGVQAYAYSASSIKRVFPGPISRVKATPMRLDARNGGTDVAEDALLAAASEGADFSTEFDGDDQRHIGRSGMGQGTVFVRVVNPEKVRDGIYSVEIVEVAVSGADKSGSGVAPGNSNTAPGPTEVRAYTIRRDGDVVFDGEAAANTLGAAPPLGEDVVSMEGLSFSIFATDTGSLMPGDTFTFSTEGLGAKTGDSETARAALDKIGIVPNPYRGASAYEVSQLVDQVRFTNLPHTATIRVFSMSGTLVRKLQKNSPDAMLRWDLTTDLGLPIASGLYLIHVETEFGSRVLKFGVIKKQFKFTY